MRSSGLPTSDRVFLIAFSVSLLIHLVLLVSRMVSLPWLAQMKQRLPLEVVYETVQANPQAEQFQAQLARAKRDAAAAPAPSQIGDRMQIRIPERPFLAGERALAESMPVRAAVVDLTDLVDASRGDPVLLSYFGAIRERIQEVANRESWSLEDDHGGLVTVSFLLNQDGSVEGVSIVPVRSIPSSSLQAASLGIVRSAAPFLPFPPSMKESSKTIVVPLEFSAGS